MPVMTGKDNEGCFACWGKQGKKYYYECGNKDARERARRRAAEQGRAIKQGRAVKAKGGK